MRSRRHHRAARPHGPRSIVVALLVLSATAGSSRAPPHDGALPDCFGLTPTIVGTLGDDLIEGSPGSDVISGLAGNDTIRGLRGDDLLCGNEGDDLLVGGVGNDTASGDEGDDRIAGSQGDDRLDGALGQDTLSGGPGDDAMNSGDIDEEGPNVGVDALTGGPGDDILTGGTGMDLLSGDQGDDILDGIGDTGDVLSGGPGDDTLRGSLGPDLVEGGPGNDALTGSEGDDRVSGGSGNDALWGGEGDDDLSGGPGNDRLLGSAGDDRLTGGPGDDLLLGGLGDDDLVDGEEPSLDVLIDAHDREGIGEWTVGRSMVEIDDAVAALDATSRDGLAEVLLDSNATDEERARVLSLMQLVLSVHDLGFYAEIWSYTQLTFVDGGFFGTCGHVFLDPGAFASLPDPGARDVLVHESFHSFNCENGGPIGSLDEGSASWVFVVGFRPVLGLGESWAEATYGTKLAHRDIDHQPDYPLTAPLDPTPRLVEVYGWLSDHDPSKLPWNSQERLVTCYERYYEQLDRDVDFETEWLPAVAVATDTMLTDPACRPV